MSLLIENGRIIDPASNTDYKGSILIKEDRIAWMGEGKPPEEADYILDADGLIVSAGFIDLHCHLREPGFEDKETIATGTMAAARGGFTTVCCMPNTKPPLDNEIAVRYVQEAAARDGVIRVLPIGCVTNGRKGEDLADLEELNLNGVAAYSDDGAPVASKDIMRQALLYGKDFGLPIIDHCENQFMTQEAHLNEGVVALEMGLRGMPAAAEELMVQRDIALAEETGGHVHIAHVSTAGSVDLIRAAKEKGLPVTAEATPHHLTLTENLVLEQGTMAKVNPPLRTQADVDALVMGLNEGVIDAVATDHAPHTAADKDCSFEKAAFGISGFETAFASLAGMVLKSQISLNTLIEALTLSPARVLGYEKFGMLQAEALADITIFDLHKEWTVDPDKFASKGKNTPLAGRKMRGKVMVTVYDGDIVYIDESMMNKVAKNIFKEN